MKFQRGTQIIECNSIEFEAKNMITIKKFEDFNWLLGSCLTVLKLNECYYHISGDEVYIYDGGKNGI